MAEPEAKLRRSLTTGSIVLFGVAYITPFIVLTTFGAFSKVSHGTLASSYAITTIAMLFTAFSYAKMAREIPSAGSAYAYARHSLGSHLGFMVGWAIMLDYLFLPMVVWLIGAAFLEAQFPGVSKWVFVLAFIVLTTGLNTIGMKVATRANFILIGFQFLVLVLFVMFSIGEVIGSPDLAFDLAPFWNTQSSISAVVGGAAIAAYSFIGFDAVSTFSEEAVDPRRTIPRAIILTAIVAGIIFVIVAYATQLVHPGGIFDNPGSASLNIAREIAGNFFAAVFLATVVVAQFTAGIPIQSAGARLMYAMGRDNVLPRRVFGYIIPRFQTPLVNLLLTGAVGLLAIILSVTTATSFINFGAFTAFAFVNISVIALYWRQRKSVKRGVISWIVQPLIGLAVILWLLTHLDIHALVIGIIWLILGVIWLGYITRIFQRPPPEMVLEE